MNLKVLKDMEYVKCADLLAGLIDLDENTKMTILKGFQSMGLENFFKRLDLMKLPPEIIEKLVGIKAVIDLSELKRGQL